MDKPQGFTTLAALLLGLAAVAIIATAVVYTAERFGGTNESGPVACTDDAKLCPDGTTVGRTGPSCEFPECPELRISRELATNQNASAETNSSAEVATGTVYHNTTFGFFLTFPEGWSRLGEFAGTPSPIVDDESSVGTFSDGTASLSMFIQQRSVGDIVHRNTIAMWKAGVDIRAESLVLIGDVWFTRIELAINDRVYYLLEHADTFFEFSTNDQPQASLAVLQTFTLDDPNAALTDIGPAVPITKVNNLREMINGFGTTGVSAVGIMGERALVGGSGGVLFYYDGTAATNISHRIDTGRADLNARNIHVRSIVSNGAYWLIATGRSGEQDSLYRFDGTTWTDLSDAMNAVKQTIATGGAHSIAWNGTYWLIADNAEFIQYDGHTFENVSDRFPGHDPSASVGPTIVEDIDWNGTYWLVVVGVNNNGVIYRYDGVQAERLTHFASDNHIQQAGWNGKEWLLGGNAGQTLLRFDGTSITDTGVTTDPFIDIVWLDPFWLVGRSLFDGTQLDPSLFTGASRVSDIDLGSSYGLLGTMDADIFRFDFVNK